MASKYYVFVENGQSKEYLSEDELDEIRDECEAKSLDYVWGRMELMEDRYEILCF